MSETYHVRVKKDYASDFINDLVKMDALEIVSEDGVPDWHMHVVSERIEAYKWNPDTSCDFDQVLDEIEYKLH